MYKYFIGALGFVMVGGMHVLAQAPMNIQPATHRETPAQCEGGTCPPLVCVPECHTKTIKTPIYKSACEPLCVSFYPLRGLFNRGNCDTGNCREPITRRYLMKKIVTSETSAVKCVPAPRDPFNRLHFATLPPTLVNKPVGLGIAPSVAEAPVLKMPQSRVAPK